MTRIEELFQKLNIVNLTSWKKEDENTFKIILKGKRNEWKLKIIFKNNFPSSLPTIKLIDEKYIGELPHVNIYGVICTELSDTILIDQTRELDILEFIINETLEELELKSLAIYEDELTDEYEGYFSDKLSFVNSFYFSENAAEILELLVARNNSFTKETPILLKDTKIGLPEYFSNVNSENSQSINILHLPLEFPIKPPSKNDMKDLNEYVNKMYSLIKDNKEMNELLLKKKKKRNNFFILFSMPRTTGERTQILVHYYSTIKKEHPLLNKNNNFIIEFFLTKRSTENYLKERGGSFNNLSNKHVTIIGCGSVGSEVAMMLAKSGVSELTLVDYDILSEDNIFRHRLGGGSLDYKADKKTLKVRNSPKVFLLGNLIQKDIPYIKINKKCTVFNRSLKDDEVTNKILKDKDILSSDIVIVAVGTPMVNLEINKILKSIELNNVIFCWNEPDSIGGHSVCLDLTKSCFECLYEYKKTSTLRNILDYVEPGQNISKNITGCLGVFTPFSYIDSSQTAILAVRQCISELQDNNNSQALSWKTTNKTSLNTTERFHNAALIESIDLERTVNCRICNENYRIIKINELFKIKILNDLIKQLFEYRQLNIKDAESCGVLIGTFLENKKGIIMDKFTAPQESDEQTRFSCFRSEIHNTMTFKIWKESKGMSSYVGLWHTHPEDIPRYSVTDKNDWNKSLNKSHYDGEHLFFFIVGKTHIRCWMGTRKRFKNKIKLIGEFNYDEFN